jgi:CRP-like cAMP-binding protein
MDRSGALERVSSQLQRAFGALVTVSELRRVRKVEGRGWVATLVVRSSRKDILVGNYELREDGSVDLPTDAVIDAIQRARVSVTNPPAAQEGGGFDDAAGDLLGDDWGEPDTVDANADMETIVSQALEKGDPASLRVARDTLPRFLADAEKRGEALVHMAEIERLLGATELAMGYLEAAAREFANRIDLAHVEHCIRLARQTLGPEELAKREIVRIGEQVRMRHVPVGKLEDVLAFRSLTEEERALLSTHVKLRTLAPGEFLVHEGQPSVCVFVLRKGILAVLLEAAEGEKRFIRACHPGMVLGESSVLVADPRCTASLRAETSAEVWAIEPRVVAEIMKRNDRFRLRFESTKYLHHLDSFFSMHDVLSQVDATLRDGILGCLHSIQLLEEDTLCLKKGELPTHSLLVGKGELALYDETEPDVAKPPSAIVKPDTFFGVRDALHQIALERTAVARRGSVIIFFDAERMRALVERSPGHLGHALERLG